MVNVGHFLKDIPNNITYQYLIKDPNELHSLWEKLKYIIKYKLIYYWLPLKWVYKLWVPKENDIEIAFVEGFSTKLLSHSHLKTEKIAWLHTDFSYNHWTSIIFTNKKQEENAYSKFNKVVCVSNVVKDGLLKLYPRLNNVIVKYNPIDNVKLLSLAQNNNLRLSSSSVKLVSTGRLVHQKGYDRLLPIIKNIIDEGYDVTLTILGEGVERNKLEEYIANNNLQDKVFLLGFVENPYAIMAKHDIFICSSRAEGYSLVIAEAMILGLPIVSTYCSGPNELLNDGEYGVLTENSEKALSQGIKSLITSPSEKKKFKRLSMQRAKQLDFKSIMQKIEDVL